MTITPDINLLFLLLLRSYFQHTPPLQDFLHERSREELVSLITVILDWYANDPNSSTLRERITVIVAGYTPTDTKLGYNGTKGNKVCEAKPVNVRRERGDKLNGGGNFSDLTPERLESYIKRNPNILVSGFVDGMLVYVIEFPFNCSSFRSRLQEQLERYFPEGQRPRGSYLRSATFNLKHYKNCPGLQIHYITPRLEEVRGSLTQPLYQFLKERAQR